jgi:mono/diheme cytochrome c family protein
VTAGTGEVPPVGPATEERDLCRSRGCRVVRRFGFGVVLAVVGLAACGGSSSTSSSSSAPRPTGAQAHDPTLLAGRTVFTGECASCHGIRGEGGAGPSFLGGRLERDFPNAEDQVAFVAAGRGIMPAFSGILTHPQIENVVAYERQVLAAAR